MTQGTYRQFCPVAMAAEILCNRWTIILVRELISGSTRFNDLRRGMPRISPALLSKRLRDLEEAGVVRRIASTEEPGVFEYHLTRSGRDLKPVVEAIGIWGQRWVESAPTLQNLDPDLLMWDMRRSLDLSPLPQRRVVVEFIYPELPAKRRRYWLVIAPGAEVDLCSIDPGFEVDLYVTADLRTMTAIWMGLVAVREALKSGAVTLTGDRGLAASVPRWLGLSRFAAEPKLATA